jgi:hypothetical protein
MSYTKCNMYIIFCFFLDEILNYIRSLEERLGLTDYPEADSFMTGEEEPVATTIASTSRPDAVSNAFKVLSIQETILQGEAGRTKKKKRVKRRPSTQRGSLLDSSREDTGEEEGEEACDEACEEGEEEESEELGEGERALVQEICKVRGEGQNKNQF